MLSDHQVLRVFTGIAVTNLPGGKQALKFCNLENAPMSARIVLFISQGNEITFGREVLMKKRFWVWVCLLVVLLLPIALLNDEASAISIDVSTNNSGWVASYESFSGPAFHYSCGVVADCISISSTGFNSGSFVGGGSAAAFTGTWGARLSFFLPLNAQNVTLAYASLGVDDRATLSLNGSDLGTFFIFGPQISGSTTTPFLLGGPNTLSLNVVNNPFNQAGAPVGFTRALPF